MVIILLGIVASVVIMYIYSYLHELKEQDSSELSSDMATELALGVLATIIVGLFLPISGYTDWQLVEEKELVSFSNQNETDENAFIIRNQDAYLYRIENEPIDNDSLKSYSTVNLDENELFRIDYTDTCTKPVVKIYQRKGKMSLLTFALGTTQKCYVFNVPNDSIKYE